MLLAFQRPTYQENSFNLVWIYTVQGDFISIRFPLRFFFLKKSSSLDSLEIMLGIYSNFLTLQSSVNFFSFSAFESLKNIGYLTWSLGFVKTKVDKLILCFTELSVNFKVKNQTHPK